MILRGIGYYRSSKKDRERNPDAHNSHIFRLKKAFREAGLPEDTLIIFDEMTGFRDDRPNFQRLVKLIENREVDIVVLRQDRLSRRSGMFSQLSDLFEKTGVRLYETTRSRFIDFSNPDDWADFQQVGVQSERERRVISQRQKYRREYMRSQGKVQGGRMPYGLRRSTEGFYEWHPEQAPHIPRIVDIFVDTRSCSTTTKLVFDELGIKFGYNGIRELLANPALRGHTVYQSGDEPPRYNSHPALIGVDDASQIDEILAQNRRCRGRAKKSSPKPLSGLLFCDRCGEIMHDMHGYLYCKAYRRGYGCDRSSAHQFPGKVKREDAVSTLYVDAERAAIEAITERIKDLIGNSPEPSQDRKEDEQVIELRSQINKSKALKIPQLEDAIARMERELQSLLTSEGDSDDVEQKRQKWIDRYQCNPDLFDSNASFLEGRILFKEWIIKILCNGNLINVLLKL